MEPEDEPNAADRETFGLVYVAFGFEFLVMAALSAASARRHNPHLHCSLVTNSSLNAGDNALRRQFDEIHHVPSDREANRVFKTRAPEFTPCDRAAYLDCDTLVLGSLDPLFAALDTFDVILKMNGDPHRKDFMIDDDLPAHLFPFWNGGVVFFRRNERSRGFFHSWSHELGAMGRNTDQPALVRAVFCNPDVRILSVNAIWNTFPNEVDQVTTERGTFRSRIWHYRSPRDTPELASTLLDMCAEVQTSVGTDDETGADIDRTVARFRLFASVWYQRPVLRRALNTVHVFLRRLGAQPAVRLRKQKAGIGDKFDEVEESRLTTDTRDLPPS